MDQRDIEHIKRLVENDLLPALKTQIEKECKSMEATITMTILGIVDTRIAKIEREHSEDRIRLQRIDSTCSEARLDAGKAAVASEAMLGRIGDLHSSTARFESLAIDLIGKVNRILGKNEGKQISQNESNKKWSKLFKWAKWLGGTIFSTGAIKWIYANWQRIK
jgi:hypothetical protein